MSLSSSTFKESLAKENYEFKQLFEAHRSYDDRLNQLSKQPYLSSVEEQEISELKKKKLFLKDQMAIMMSSLDSR